MLGDEAIAPVGGANRLHDAGVYHCVLGDAPVPVATGSSIGIDDKFVIGGRGYPGDAELKFGVIPKGVSGVPCPKAPV